MGCGCKKDIKNKTEVKKDKKVKNGKFKEPLYARIILFLIIMVSSPIWLLVVGIILFNYFFIDNKIDMVKYSVIIDKKFRKTSKDTDNDSDDYNIYVDEELD